MKQLFVLLSFLSFLSFNIGAQDVTALSRQVEETQRSAGMQHATLAVCVYDVQAGRTLYTKNAQLSVTPASVQKLLTTGVGFAQLGSQFRFVTKMSVRGDIDREGVLHGNIYIEGGGDPLLGSYRYRQTTPDSLFAGWLTALRRKGVRRVDGRVCYNTSVFDDRYLHDKWQWGDVGNYYASGVSGLNFHENMYFVYFNPGARLGHPASAVSVKPKNIEVRGVCEVTTGPENSGDQVTIYGSPTSTERIYRGTVPFGKKNFAVRGAMPNPAQNCADIFASYLRTNGIGISANSMRVYSRPDSLRSIIDQYSPEYYTIAQYTNLTSNNTYAESIFKYLGHKRYGTGSFENGAKAVMDYLHEKGIDVGGVKVEDGSGLSRGNRVTAEFLCRYLAAIAREPFYEDFIVTLADKSESVHVPSGTVRLKTGTMDGVKSYAGYIITPQGKTFTFCIISNSHECSSQEVAAKLNLILAKIATLN